MRRVIGIAALLALAGAPAAAQPPAPTDGDTAPVDYARDDAWICRPGVGEETCARGLDAAVAGADGRVSVQRFAPAAAPAIDCFYVYPTVSADPTAYSDMDIGPEERRAVRAQAARLGQACRLFVPAYHQVTIPALRYRLAMGDAGEKGAAGLRFDVPYRDVAAAFAAYMARDNHGRGVVLVGHSQGAMLLKELIAREIDGKPARARLVGAYLAGNPDLTAASFRTVPACRAFAQTGCVVAWSSYREGYEGARAFGGGEGALCVDPAGEGRQPLDAYLPAPATAPAGSPPFVEVRGGLSAECRRDARGAVLSVRIEPGPAADRLEQVFEATGRGRPSWGLHPLDVSLVEGDMVRRVAAQAAAWGKR